MQIALINIGTADSGIIRKALAGQHSIANLALDDFVRQAAVIPHVREPEKPAERAEVPIPEGKVREVREYINALLDGAVQVASDKRGAVQAVPASQPDIIFYGAPEDSAMANREITLMRKASGFRDIVIVACERSGKAGRAEALIASGANQVMPLPMALVDLAGQVEALGRPVGGPVPVITRLLNPFISAATDLMGTMAGLSVKRTGLFLKRNYRLFGDISGVMRLSGKIHGSAAVSFTESLAREVVAKILRIEPDSISPEELKDGVSEIVNIVSGNAKALLAGTEYECAIALPGVVEGAWVELQHPELAPCVAVIFEAEGRQFAVQVTVAVKKETRNEL